MHIYKCCVCISLKVYLYKKYRENVKKVYIICEICFRRDDLKTTTEFRCKKLVSLYTFWIDTRIAQKTFTAQHLSKYILYIHKGPYMRAYCVLAMLCIRHTVEMFGEEERFIHHMHGLWNIGTSLYHDECDLVIYPSNRHTLV